MGREHRRSVDRAGVGVKDILFLAHRVPFPPDRGDKIRGYHIVRYLAGRARVHLVAFADTSADRDPAPEFRNLLESCTIVPRTRGRFSATLAALASGRPVSLTAFDSPVMHRAVAAVVDAHPTAATYAFSGQMAQYLPRRGVRIMDFVDRDSAKFAGYADTARPPMRWMLHREARLLARHEDTIAAHVDATLFVSAAEAALLPGATVMTVENGIDAARFDPAAAFERVAEPGPLIVFTGQMDYPPNVEAVVWFATAILPLIRLRHPAARFAIVGRAPTTAVRALAGSSVLVTGEVADVRGWLAAADVVVAPLKLARGIQNKVLEAMAMARPVVASAAAAEGIDHAGTIRTGRDAATIAAAVGTLLDDPVDAQALGVAARAQVLRRYAWDARLAPLDALLGLDPLPARAAA